MYCTRTVQFLVSFFFYENPYPVLFNLYSFFVEALRISSYFEVLSHFVSSKLLSNRFACLPLWMYVYICIVFEIMILRSGETGIGENAFVQF